MGEGGGAARVLNLYTALLIIYVKEEIHKQYTYARP